MPYAARENIEAIFGKANVATWADLDADGDGTTITARINAALEYGADYIDRRLRDTRYEVPLSMSSGSGPRTIIDLNARLAGLWLYESRGIEDTDPETGRPLHRLHWHRREVDRTLDRIAAGQDVLDAKLKDDRAPTSPAFYRN